MDIAQPMETLHIGRHTFSLDSIVGAMEAGTGFCTSCGKENMRKIVPESNPLPCLACGAEEVHAAEDLIFMGEIK